MIILPGYQVECQIHEGADSIIYRGVRDKDLQPVIIKVLNKQYPSQDELNRFKREYEVMRFIDSDGVVKAYHLEKYQNTLAMILEDFKGESIAKLPADREIDLADFLRLSILIAEALGQIHYHQIIHKDINPGNIIWNPETNQVKITDFDLSTQFHHDHSDPKAQYIKGTLPYISPEQTGRMNLDIDYRSDFYSLGVTSYYRKLTHRLPFEFTDPMQLVHSHLAVTPIAPCVLNPRIPKPVSDIVMKLMAKNAHDRYQSIFGLQADLVECLYQIEEKGYTEEFELGKNDFSGIFSLPQKIYGREKEIETLVEALNRVKHAQKEAVLISGNPGIGKSSIIKEFFKAAIPEHGFMLYGKFNQRHQNVPYSALINAFAELILQIASAGEEQVFFWKTKLLQSLGVNARVMIDVIPELELIIGSQPAPPELLAAEARNRFNRTFLNFLQTFTDKESGLTICIDDLQWADEPSLALIELFLITPDIQYVLFVGAYRDNEVNDSHPLISALSNLKKSGIPVTRIIPDPLDESHLRQIISETLSCRPGRADSLARLLAVKTQGNPFFLRQLLQYLYEKRLFVFDLNQGRWKWDVEKIRDIAATENVVSLMTERIQQIPEKIKGQLQLAACIGTQFDLPTLSMVSNQSMEETINNLLPALEEGFVIPTNEILNRIKVDGQKFGAHGSNAMNQRLHSSYRFAHDHIWHAVYSQVSDTEKQRLHLKIGFLYSKIVPAP